MAPDKAPAFQFYPKDFLTDEKVVLMSNTEVGIYMRLLCFCWLEGTLPLETESLARMARMPLKQFTKLWERSVLRSCFQVSEDGRLHHKRLDLERQNQQEHTRRQGDRGRAGAEARWHKHGASNAQAMPSDGGARMLGDGSSSPSSSPSPVQTTKKARPVFQGQCFSLFDWQIGKLNQRLGSNAKAFGIEDWIQVVDAGAFTSGQVVPADPWPWIQGLLDAEIKKRGLRMADTASAKSTSYPWDCPHTPKCGNSWRCNQIEVIAREKAKAHA